jgi:hypothetical protein
MNWQPNIPAATLFALLVLALCLSYARDEIKSVRRKREAAREIVAEHEAREFLDQQWKESH